MRNRLSTMRFATLVAPLAALVLLAMAATGVRAESLFPRPAGLDRDVAFWTNVYTKINTDEGYVHDTHRLDIVYETLRFAPGMSDRARDRAENKAKARYRKILEQLASGKREGLSDEAYAVLLEWGPDTDNATFRTASRRVRFQLGQSDRFQEGLIRSGAWMAHIRGELTRMRLPQELAVLPHVESSFNARAWSHAGAAGMWQITRPTGRRYMRIDHVVDERMDPIQATRAALEILEDNHRITGSWPLALTAYNSGTSGMRRAVRKLGTDDIETIVRKHTSRSFRFASRNFYVAFLAALDVDARADEYFGTLDREPVQLYTTVSVDAFINVADVTDALGVSKDVLRSLNPALQRAVWNGDKRIPRDYALRLPAEYAPPEAAARLASVPEALKHPAQVLDEYHKVRRGETLSGIAKRYGVSVSSIMGMNNLRSRHRIRIGQIIRLPVDGAKPATRVAGGGKPPASSSGTYVVRSGDTLSHIARRFGLSERRLAAANNLSNKHRIYPGQVLRVSL